MDQEPQKQPEKTPSDTEVPAPPEPETPTETPAAEAEPAPVAEPAVSEQPAVRPLNAPGPKVNPAATDAGRPNQLAALMLTSSFGYYGVHQLYLGNQTQGFVRLGLAVLAVPLMFLLVGFLIVPVLAIWTLYDFVRIGFGKATDAHGKPLVGSERDANWSKVLTVVALALLGLYLLFVILFVSMGVFAGLNSSLDSSSPSGPFYDL